jgi:hypothetical protein
MSNCICVSDSLHANALLRSKLYPTSREPLLISQLVLHRIDVATIAKLASCVRMMSEHMLTRIFFKS